MISSEMVAVSIFIRQGWKRGYIDNDLQLAFELVPLGYSLACLLFMGYCLQFQHHMLLVKGQLINQFEFCYCCLYRLMLPFGHLSL